VTVAEVLMRRHGDLTPAERKVARVLTAQYPLPGLDTVSRLASRAGVSAPTVIRLVGKLGFGGYPDFQQTLKTELGERLSSPLAMYATRPQRGADGVEDVLGSAIDTFGEGIRSSLSGVSPAEMLTIVGLLADERRPVSTVGGRFSGVLAACLAAHLQEVRPLARQISDSPAERAASLLDIGRKDVIVAFDYRRYQHDTVRLAMTAKEQGATLIAFTDPYLSPLAARADVILTSSVQSPSPFDALTPAVALLEALIAALVDRLGDAPRARMARYDALNGGMVDGTNRAHDHEGEDP